MTVQTRIEELARSKLLGRRTDPVGFVDELLALARREGEIHCACASNEALRFTFTDRELAFDVPVDRARGKLRMMCARLGVLCNESGDQDVCLYGGEGTIAEAATSIANQAIRDEGMAAEVFPNGIPDRSLRPTADGTPPDSLQLRPVPTGGGVSGGTAKGATTTLRQQLWKVRFKNTMHEHEFTIQRA